MNVMCFVYYVGTRCDLRWLEHLREDVRPAAEVAPAQVQPEDSATNSNLVSEYVTETEDDREQQEQIAIVQAHSVADMLVRALTRRPPSEQMTVAVERFRQRIAKADRTTSGMLSFLHGGASGTIRR